MNYWELLGAVAMLSLGVIVLVAFTYEIITNTMAGWDWIDTLVAFGILLVGSALIAGGVQGVELMDRFNARELDHLATVLHSGGDRPFNYGAHAIAAIAKSRESEGHGWGTTRANDLAEAQVMATLHLADRVDALLTHFRQSE